MPERHPAPPGTTQHHSAAYNTTHITPTHSSGARVPHTSTQHHPAPLSTAQHHTAPHNTTRAASAHYPDAPHPQPNDSEPRDTKIHTITPDTDHTPGPQYMDSPPARITIPFNPDSRQSTERLSDIHQTHGGDGDLTYCH